MRLPFKHGDIVQIFVEPCRVMGLPNRGRDPNKRTIFDAQYWGISEDRYDINCKFYVRDSGKSYSCFIPLSDVLKYVLMPKGELDRQNL